MKLSDLVKALAHIEKQYDHEVEVYLTVSPNDAHNGEITQHEQFFVGEQPNDDGKMCVELRTFPY